MYRLVPNIASKSRNARKCITQFGSCRLSSTRSYSAKDTRSGVKELSDTGQVNIGPPKGCNVTFEQSSDGNITITHSWREPKVKKDGVTVAKKGIESKDRVVKNVGSSPVKQVSKATNNVAGNGTTYATFLTRAIRTEACKAVAAGKSVYDETYLRHGIKLAVDTVVKTLRSRARMISTFEEIAQVGTTAANGDREIGELVAKAIEIVGKEGVIRIQAGDTSFDELEIVDGMKIDRGYRSPFFITKKKTQTCELEDPLILIHEKEITSPDPMSKVTGPDSMSTILELALQKLEHPSYRIDGKEVTKFGYMTKVVDLALKKQRSLLIIAEDLDSFSVAGLIWKTPFSYDFSRLATSYKTHSAEMKLCAVKAPGFGENRRAYMQDLATLTGAQVITEEGGMSLEKIDLGMLGTCKKVIVSKDNTVFIGGAGDKKNIEERCEQIQSMVEASESDYDKDMLQDRLAKLSGVVAVIKIGGTSEREIRIDRATNALNAAKAALEEGIVPGGGVALLHASKELEKISTKHFILLQVGVRIIQNALEMPVYTIASNAGADGEVIVDKLLESDNPDIGYDAAKGEYVDMVKSGIIDPVKVIRTALVTAARNAKEAAVTDIPTKEDMSAAMGGGGKDDMGF